MPYPLVVMCYWNHIRYLLAVWILFVGKMELLIGLYTPRDIKLVALEWVWHSLLDVCIKEHVCILYTSLLCQLKAQKAYGKFWIKFLVCGFIISLKEGLCGS
ncbi:hypothetical protein LguiB_018631 [Lonicera macranthoides]